MTTIAYDGKTICADSLVTAGGVRKGAMVKIVKTRNGWVACAGALTACVRVVDWITDGADVTTTPALSEDEEFQCLWVDRKRKVWYVDGAFTPYPAWVPSAIGSGADFALAALTLGIDARGAVELGIKLDCYSGGDIQEVSV